MKKIKTTLTTFLALLTVAIFAQKSVEDIDLKKDFDVSGKGIIKKATHIAPVKVAVHFKTISNGKASIGKGQNRTSSTAWAILDGVSEATMQEITDEFAASLNQKLSDLGLSIIEWNKITAAKNYAKVTEKQREKYWDNKNEGALIIKTANDGPHTKQVIGNPGIWGALAKVGKDVGANSLVMDVVVDFANFNIKMKRDYGITYTSTSAQAEMFPEVSIQSSNGGTGFGMMTSSMTFVGKYGEATIITLRKDINFNHNIADAVEDYAGKQPASMKKVISFGSTLNTGSFIVKANEAEYKKAVLGALNQYADFMLEKIKEIRN